MTRLPMSRSGAAVLRAFLARAPSHNDRILLTAYRSTDWQSLTFTGERHEFQFRIAATAADELHEMLTKNLEDAEFAIPRHVLADIRVDGPAVREPDGSLSFAIEALTIAD
jgi:hypothetical protein